MRFFDLLIMSINNLRRRKLRTGLTVLGVVIGTASIVVMVSLGIGLKENTVDFVFLYFAVPFYSSDNTFSIVKNSLAVNLFTILRKSPAGTQQFSPNLRQFKNHSRINIIRILNLIQLDNGLHMLCVLIIIPAYFQ